MLRALPERIALQYAFAHVPLSFDGAGNWSSRAHAPAPHSDPVVVIAGKLARADTRQRDMPTSSLFDRAACCWIDWIGAGPELRELRRQRAALYQHFVQDFAGLGIAVVVHFLGLTGAKNLQCSARKLRINEGVLQRDDQAVAWRATGDSALSERHLETAEGWFWSQSAIVSAGCDLWLCPTQ
jgi:hypothetical protein